MLDDLKYLGIELGHIVGTGRRNWLLIDVSASALGFLWWLIQSHFWASPQLLLLVMLLTAADFATGVAVGAKQKKLETRKFKRGLYTVVALAGVLFFAHNFAKYDPQIFGWLPQTVFVPMVVIQLSSLIKNLSLLGYMPTKIANALWETLDKYKNPTDQNDEPQAKQ